MAKVQRMVPPMLDKFHKGAMRWDILYDFKSDADLSPGQLGRVAVIGGSQDYTGAPFFSAMASARLGCDMVTLPLPTERHMGFDQVHSHMSFAHLALER